VPYEQFAEGEATFKMPREFTIHGGGANYSALVKSFAVFFSDIEIEPSRFLKISKKFSGVTSVEQLTQMGIPMLQNWYEPESKTTIVEFDLTQRQKLKEALDVRAM
jgi:hypothetical protein